MPKFVNALTKLATNRRVAVETGSGPVPPIGGPAALGPLCILAKHIEETVFSGDE